MKNIFIKFLLGILMCISYNEVRAQSVEGTGPDCLGIWCYVDVSLSDPVIDNRLVYSIPAPPHAITGMYGPGAPTYTNPSGGYIEIQLFRAHLVPELDDTDESTILDIEMTIDNYINGYECHYHIKLVLTR